MKKLFVRQFAILVCILTLTGCGDWKQDPMGNAKDKLGQGQAKPDEKAQKPTLPADYIMMEAPLFKLVKENEKVEIKLDARVILPNYTLTIQVRNLSQFPGATFDAATNTFVWTPPVGTATDDITEMSLEFVAFASAPGQVVVAREKTTKIGVARTLLEPTIVEVTSLATEIREGTAEYFTVTVEDQTAGTSNAEFPRLFARNSPSVQTLAPFVEIGSPAKTATGFKFSVTIRLADAEVTKDRTVMGFELVPISKYNKSGPAHAISVDVLTNLSDVVATWQEPLFAPPGTKIDYQFVVFDPKQEGNVNLERSTGPTNSALTCQEDNTNSTLACRFVWEVPTTATGSHRVSATFNNTSRDSSDTDYQSTYMNFYVATEAKAGRK